MTTEELYQTGYAFYQQGQLDEAIRHFEQVIAQDPKNMYAWYLMGLSFIQLEQWTPVIGAFQHVLDLEPDEGDAWANMGFAHYQLEEYNQAIAAFENALETGLQDNAPDQVWYNLGLAHKEKAFTDPDKGLLNRYDGALNAFSKCLEINPNHAAAMFQLGVVCIDGNFLYDAVDYFKKVIAFAPDSDEPIIVQSYVGLATAYCALDRYSDSLDALKTAIRIEPRVKNVARTDPGFEKLRKSTLAEEFKGLLA